MNSKPPIVDLRVVIMLGACIAFLVFLLINAMKRPRKGTLPGPRPYPILGNLHVLGTHRSPFEALTVLSRKYGPVYSLKLGTADCVVVSSYPLIREVLITKGSDFGGRPDFIRFHKLFGGDRNNSLALCDWSDLQKTRRSIARLYCSPRFASSNYERLSEIGASEIEMFLAELPKNNLNDFNLKPMIMAACANMFTGYMCSVRFDYKDQDFAHMVHTFDEIFWEINQGYAVDFLPWMEVFYSRHMNKLSAWSKDIRHFILRRIIDEHRASIDATQPPRDFTDALLFHLNDDADLSWQHIIYELEDFIGGHSAVGNLVMLVLGHIVLHPDVGRRIFEEIEDVTGGHRAVLLSDKPYMPYTEATILETLRITSSPIVPHVATTETTISGHAVEKGTVIFLNNYELNTGKSHWDAPENFNPDRFVVDGKIVKPEHFIPFSTGKRTCIGQRLVQGFSFVLLASILQHFNVCANPKQIKIFPACVALPPKTFRLTLQRRSDANEKS